MVGFGGRGGLRAPRGLGKSSRVAAVKLKAPTSPPLPFPGRSSTRLSRYSPERRNRVQVPHNAMLLASSGFRISIFGGSEETDLSHKGKIGVQRELAVGVAETVEGPKKPPQPGAGTQGR